MADELVSVGFITMAEIREHADTLGDVSAAVAKIAARLQSDVNIAAQLARADEAVQVIRDIYASSRHCPCCGNEREPDGTPYHKPTCRLAAALRATPASRPDGGGVDLRPGLERAATWYAETGWQMDEDDIPAAIRALTPAPEGAQATPPAPAAQLAAALERMLRHSCVSDAASEDKLGEDHEAETMARNALATYRATHPTDQPATHAVAGDAAQASGGGAPAVATKGSNDAPMA